jgi:regulator of protease activity HflC (stomatin/prohibitin superfamily)
MPQPNFEGLDKKIFIKFVVGLVVVWFLFSTFVIISAGHRGVVLNFGAVSGKVLNEGIHFVIPIVQSVQKIEVRTTKLDIKAAAYSKDLQTVETEIALNYHVDPLAVNALYQQIGMDYESRIIQPAVQESVKSVTANFTAQELIERRSSVKEQITLSLAERLVREHLVVDELSITNFDFSDSYEQAVEAKQVAQQQVLKADNELQRIKIEAEQKIATAKAEAESIRIQAEAITQQGGKEYVNMKWVEKWDGKLPTTSLGNGATPLVNLPR